MFQQTGGSRNERTTVKEGGNKDEGKRGKKRMTKGGEDYCRGIGGRLSKQTRRDKGRWWRERSQKTDRWRRKGTLQSVRGGVRGRKEE